jgi:hypothetical protein
MVASASAVKVNNNLSINGFIDGSYVKVQNGDAGEADSQSLGLDEVELNFNLNVGNVSGSIHIDNNNERAYTSGYTAGSASVPSTSVDRGGVDANGTASTPSSANNRNQNDLDIEQAYFTYNINDAISLTFGRYGSALGFEREDPAGLYTYSRAYGGVKGGSFNFGNVDANAVEGITIAYSADAYSIAASFEEQAGNFSETEDLNLELSFTYTGIAGVNIGGGYFFDNTDSVANGETDALNLHASKQVGKFLLAAEYVQLDTTGSSTAANNRKNDGYMLLADYDHNDKLGLAVRLSNNENGTNVADYEALTIAPNYAVTDSLGVIVEYTDFEGADTDASKGESIAVELTYTF